jgi:hypothetical protein
MFRDFIGAAKFRRAGREAGLIGREIGDERTPEPATAAAGAE